MTDTAKFLAVSLFMGIQTLTVLADTPAPKSKEEIYVVRSFSIARSAPTDFCSQVDSGFGKLQFENRYMFKSISVQTKDGHVTNTDVNTVGNLRACFGDTSDSKVRSFFARGSLGHIAFTGRGECLTDRQDFPESGVSSVRCYLHLRDLPDQFVGGLLTTNTITSRQVTGGISDPPGYTQPSIATVRLWKKRP